MLDNAPEGQSADIDVDSLMQSIEAPGGHEIPMSAPAPTPQAPEAPQEFEFTHNGKQIKANADRMKQWAQQGYDYSQRVAKFKEEQTSFEKARQEHEQKYGVYKQVDEYFQQNPDKWQAIEATFKTGQPPASAPQTPAVDPNNPLARELETLKGKIGELSQFKQELLTKEQKAKRESEDKAIEGEVQSMRESYKHLDWETPDEAGKTLEYKVLEYGNQRGIKNFQDAFIAFNHQRILQMERDRAKESVVKEQQKRTKLGLLGESPTPKRQLSEAKNLKSKSYNDLMNEALEELGSG